MAQVTFLERWAELPERVQSGELFPPAHMAMRFIERVPGRLDARCKCGVIVQLWRLIDVRHLPAAITGGEAFACDGCWSRWIRTKRLSKSDWFAHHGAPQADIDKVRGSKVDFVP